MAKTIEARIKSLINKHGLARVEISIGDFGIVAMALPASYSPIVSVRRQEAFAKLEADGVAKVSLEQARGINDDALKPCGRVKADTIDLAITALTEALK